MSPSQYAEYEAAVAEFFEREGIVNLSTAGYQEGCVEPHFSSRPCDCCAWPAGDRYDASGYNPTALEVQSGYSVCPDCIYYAEYGCLDDATMLAIA